MRTCNLRIIAFVLLLAFTQKLGLRVLLHNKYHASPIKNSNAGGNASYYQVQCDCLDEALIPIDKAEVSEMPQPAENHPEVQANYNVLLSSALKIYRSLRAPPAA